MSIYYVLLIIVAVYAVVRLADYFISKKVAEKVKDSEKLRKIKSGDLVFRAIIICGLIVSFTITLCRKWSNEAIDIIMLLVLIALVILVCQGFIKKFKEINR